MSQLKLLKALGRAPLMTMTLEQIKELDLSSNPWRDVNDLIEEGMAFRLARGVYTAIPLNKETQWRPMLEIQALALATARYGDAALMGLGGSSLLARDSPSDRNDSRCGSWRPRPRRCSRTRQGALCPSGSGIAGPIYR